MSESWKVWERRVAAHAQERDLPWERRLHLGAHRDLLDMDGCLTGGWLVGMKSISRGATFGAKISEAMDQCDRALVNIGRPHRTVNGKLLVDSGGIIPVQVMQRAGYPVGKAYVVTEYDYLLDLAVQRQEWGKE